LHKQTLNWCNFLTLLCKSKHYCSDCPVENCWWQW